MNKVLFGVGEATEDGGVAVNMEARAIELVAICKAAGMPREHFFHNMNSLWDDITVTQVDVVPLGGEFPPLD